MQGLKAVEQFIAAELEQRMAGGEDCPRCGTLARFLRPHCRTCNGSGKSPAIAEAEEALEALRGEMERVERLQNKTPLDRLTTFLETPLEEFFDEVPVCYCGAPSPDGATCWKCKAAALMEKLSQVRKWVESPTLTRSREDIDLIPLLAIVRNASPCHNCHGTKTVTWRHDDGDTLTTTCPECGGTGESVEESEG